MNHWQSVLNDVNHKSAVSSDIKTPINVRSEKKIQFHLKGPYNNTYLTWREAQCTHYLLKGCTIKDTAQRLTLSPRTVEFYVKNMRLKVGATSKAHLLEILMQTELPHKIRAVVDARSCQLN
jgi:DNA-binding CsgD family transcriptional regulator